jgi:hypothetical protein
MKKKFRVFAMIIAILLISSIFAGCNNAQDTTQDTTQAPETNNEATEAPSQSSEEQEPENQEPVKVVFYINNGFNADTASNPDSLQEVHDWFLDQINVDFDYIIPPVEKAEEKLNLILASDQQCDAFWGSWQQYSAQEMIQSITGIYNEADYPGIAKEFGPYMSVMKDADGEIWGLPRTFDTAPYPFIYRKDYADAVGITSAPTTIEELNSLLYAFADQDVAGNGETIPLIATNINSLASCLLAGYTDGGNALWLDEADGKVKLAISQPGYKDFMTQVAKWYEDGILYKEAFNINTTQLRELVKEGRVASSLEWYSAMGVAIQQMYQADENTEAVGAFTHSLTGPEGICETAAKGSNAGLLISAKASEEVAAACLKMVDFQLADLNAWYNATYGIDGWYFNEGSEVAASPVESDGNVGTDVYKGEYRVGIGKLRIDEFTELLAADKRYVETNGETAGIFFYWLYTEHLYEAANEVFQPFDYRLTFNETEVEQEVPALADIKRMQEEELVKFATGARDLSEWDDFIAALYNIGLDKVEDAYTTQYEALK